MLTLGPMKQSSPMVTKAAIRGYREINMQGLKLVKDGGYFATCSCSHFMTPELFTKTIAEAAGSVHRRLRQIEYRTQACDHPILWSGQNTTDGATKTMEDMISSFGDQIDVVFCHNDDTAIGAMNACKSAGLTDVTIVGFDGNKTAAELIASDETTIKATVAQQPYAMGYEVVKAAYAAINGESVDEVISAPVKVVTAENAQEYLDSLA